jgi:D-glycero-D-manno-heptose 1,7-bisphosphate phosphatase
MHRALFLDRDGVINVDHGYISQPEQFEVIDGVFDALRRAQALGYLLVVVTNQSGMARGYFTLSDYRALEDHMRTTFSAEGITFAGIYHCPHHPEGSVPGLALACDCRKPGPGLILQAAREHDIDLGASIMVGDKQSDIAAAEAAGIGRSYLLDSPRFTLRDINFGSTRQATPAPNRPS